MPASEAPGRRPCGCSGECESVEAPEAVLTIDDVLNAHEAFRKIDRLEMADAG